MSANVENDRVRRARRIGMNVLVAIIVWTIGAVAVGVLSGAIETDDTDETQQSAEG